MSSTSPFPAPPSGSACAAGTAALPPIPAALSARTAPLTPAARTASTLAALGIVLLAGCATTPPVAAPAGPTLSVAEARRAPPEAPVEVRWGGTIAAVTNAADGTTVLEIVSRPLRRNGRPIRDDRTDGRFLAEVDTFLDPRIVVTGRDMTVGGRVTELREGRIGEAPYAFPVVRVDDYRYWKPEPVRVPAAFPHPYPVSDHGYGGFHDDFWHGWPHSPHHHHYRGGAFVRGTARF